MLPVLHLPGWVDDCFLAFLITVTALLAVKGGGPLAKIKKKDIQQRRLSQSDATSTTSNSYESYGYE